MVVPSDTCKKHLANCGCWVSRRVIEHRTDRERNNETAEILRSRNSKDAPAENSSNTQHLQENSSNTQHLHTENSNSSTAK